MEGTSDEAAGIAFLPDGRLVVQERKGKVRLVENGIKASQPLTEINEEVGGGRDYALLGLALHPNFSRNGHVLSFSHHRVTGLSTCPAPNEMC